MDRRRLSYATVVGGNTTSAGPPSGSALPRLMNPSPLSTVNDPYYPAATAERIAYPSSFAENNVKSTQTHTWGTLPVFKKVEEAPYSIDKTMMIRPSYLSGSKYLERLDAQYQAKVSRLLGIRTPSLSKSSSGTSLHRMAPSHRGMTYEIIENTPPEAEDDLTPPLPSKWGEKDKNGGLEIFDMNEIKYVGVSKAHDQDAAAARTDHPIPRRCGVYYYEVTVLSKGKDGMIAIGFSTPKAALEKLPGWELESWGYHGDDGKAFGCGQAGRSYGPVFSVEDVIGCGIIFQTGKAFFTKNGVLLGYAFHDLAETLNHKKVYASVGMKRPGGHVKVNFGHDPFEFDIDELVRAERKRVRSEIGKQDVGRLHPKLNSTELLAELISQYLRHDGFIQTTESFSSEVFVEAASLRQEKQVLKPQQNQHDIHAIQRQKIRSAILDGDIDLALELTSAHYPSVFEENPGIIFRLKCRKFIEMMRFPTTNSSKDNPFMRKSKSTSDQDMEIDDQDGAQESNGDGLHVSDATGTNRFQQALTYAQELREEYRSDNSIAVSQAFGEIFALFAYENPSISPAAELVAIGGRVPVAEGLNSAILVSLGAPSTTSLETIYQQTQSLLEDNIDHGGSGALINLDRNIDGALDDPSPMSFLRAEPQLLPA